MARIKDAVQQTEAAGTAHLAIDSDAMSNQGSVTKRQVNHLTTVGDIRFAGPDLSVSTKVTGNSSAPSCSTAVYIGTNFYVNTCPPRGTWDRGTDGQPYSYLGSVDAQALMTTEGPVTVVGAQEVDGRPTTEYLVPVPGSTTTVPLTNSNNQPFSRRITTAPFVLSVWLDGAGRIVRTQGSLVDTASGENGSSSERTTSTLSDFGKVVHIVAPARFH